LDSRHGLALHSSKDAIARFVPAGLLGVLGVRNVDELTRRASGMVEQTERAAARRWVPLVAIAAAILIGFLAFQSRNRAAQEVQNTAATAARTLTAVNLPGGSTLNVEQNGFLYNLTRYLGSADPTPKTFVFDHLNFETGGTTLTPASGSTVTDLTRVLNAYPSSQVKLVGYTDTTGDPATNTTLSLARAKAVADLLASGGVAASRVTTEGLGSANPVASNDTEEGRAKNRRIELTVLQK
jgi:outer membrane protein OmpA-like peptidoglycan-associated protein